MKLPCEDLSTLVRSLRERSELDYKRDIQKSALHFGRENCLPWMPHMPPVKNGDDAAALRQPDGSYLLIATDGMRAEFVQQDPWFAGYSSVMVNVADIAAMGGRPWAIVDVMYLGEGDSDRLLLGMQAASQAFGVPIVGGHTCRTSGPTVVSCAIVGNAQVLLESDRCRPGDELLYAVDLRGAYRSPTAFNAATTKKDSDLRAQIDLLPQLAEAGLVTSAKDVSNAGLIGTVCMLLESSGVGAQLDLLAVPAPEGIEPLRWLTSFPSFGFVLGAPKGRVERVRAAFGRLGVECERIGTITEDPRLVLRDGAACQTFCDTRIPFTGWGTVPQVLAG